METMETSVPCKDQGDPCVRAAVESILNALAAVPKCPDFSPDLYASGALCCAASEIFYGNSPPGGIMRMNEERLSWLKLEIVHRSDGNILEVDKVRSNEFPCVPVKGPAEYFRMVVVNRRGGEVIVWVVFGPYGRPIKIVKIEDEDIVGAGQACGE